MWTNWVLSKLQQLLKQNLRLRQFSVVSILRFLSIEPMYMMKSKKDHQVHHILHPLPWYHPRIGLNKLRGFLSMSNLFLFGKCLSIRQERHCLSRHITLRFSSVRPHKKGSKLRVMKDNWSQARFDQLMSIHRLIRYSRHHRFQPLWSVHPPK